MRGILLDDALMALGPGFLQEVRSRLAPVKDRFFQTSPQFHAEHESDGLHSPPMYLTDPELRKVAIELAELALQRGLDVNIACEPDITTFLHGCVLLRGSTIAEAVTWFLRMALIRTRCEMMA